MLQYLDDQCDLSPPPNVSEIISLLFIVVQHVLVRQTQAELTILHLRFRIKVVFYDIPS